MKTQMTTQQAITMYSVIEALCNQFDSKNLSTNKSETAVVAAYKQGLRNAHAAVKKKASEIYVGNNPIREGIKRGMSDAQIEILTLLTKEEKQNENQDHKQTAEAEV